MQEEPAHAKGADRIGIAHIEGRLHIYVTIHLGFANDVRHPADYHSSQS
jgi:hypothetical protein